MRRREKEIRDQSVIEQILQEVMVCRLGLARNNQPYIVPMNFLFENGNFYFHTSRVGKKIDYLIENDSACIEVDIPGRIIDAQDPCRIGFSFQSVIAFGTASFIDDEKEKVDILGKLTKKYTGKEYTFQRDDVERVAIIKIVTDKITGKQG